ncbi:class I adenylate-forming enzyme family protein [Polynucleobacter sphagniphilus]|uniref:class I adenylate-forming enzyme family protein n=1 Tax=Polynucleobacter sphagniphilus TaxID=1743169 RepID=UPI002476F102|nr:class I adenylate-forming enzyme family protein [Polynucleobacter sphagniphilus]MDH6524547.1 acyl-coenzyme A synthetase/AMP-(fatty) acid ligase [Polynucleobacter sphagniphilus]
MPNLIHYLDFQAKRHPQRLALSYGNSSFSFLQLQQLVKSLAKKLRASGVKPGQIVSTQLNNPPLHVAMTLALLHEATVSCSVADHLEIPSEVPVDFYLIDPDHLGCTIPAEKCLLIDTPWIESAVSKTSNEEAHDYDFDNSLCRLILSSGTTGTPKAIPITHTTLASRCFRRGNLEPQLGCELSFFDVCSSIGFYAIFKPLLTGLPLALPFSYEHSLADLNRLKISNLGGSPNHLTELMQFVKSPPPNHLQLISTAGSLVGVNLINQIKTHLCPNIISRYGSSETSTMAICSGEDLLRHSGAAGFVLPENQLQIVDEFFMPVPSGEAGLIGVKTPDMATEYFNNAKATGEHFIDGWFYPGDIGCQREDGLLVLEGRQSDVINLGGVKVNPNTIDHLLLEQSGIIDCATIGLANALGIEELFTAVVVQADTRASKLSELIVSQLPPIYNTTKLITLKTIPRNAAGKLIRVQLKEALRHFLPK